MLRRWQNRLLEIFDPKAETGRDLESKQLSSRVSFVLPEEPMRKGDMVLGTLLNG